MKWMGWLRVVAGLVLVAGPARADWKVVLNGNCTAQSAATVSGPQTAAAVYCCTGSGQGFCNRRMNFGDLFEVHVTLVGTGIYTAGGDPLVAAELAKIGLGTITAAQCEAWLNNADPPTVINTSVIRRTAAAPFTLTRIFGYVPSTNLQVAGSIAGHSLQCLFWGY